MQPQGSGDGLFGKSLRSTQGTAEQGQADNPRRDKLNKAHTEVADAGLNDERRAL